MQRLKKSKSHSRQVNPYRTMQENQLETMITKWNSKLRSLETEYTDFVDTCNHAIRDTQPGNFDAIRKKQSKSALS